MASYKRLKIRGWSRDVLEPLFVESHNNISSKKLKPRNAVTPMPSRKETVMLHLEYNKYDIPKRKVRELWDETCPVLEKDTVDGGLGIKKVICAYSRPRNLKDLLQSAKLKETNDHKASSYF